MLIDWIEPGQRLQMKTGAASAVVEVLAEAVVPARYWVCRDEASGQRRVIARTALFPMHNDAPVEVAAAPAASVQVSTPTPTALVPAAA